MIHPNFVAALRYAEQLLAIHGNDKIMLSFDCAAKVWMTFNCTSVEGICEFADAINARSVCLLQHQACITTLAHPDFPRLDDYLTAWAGTGDPINCQPSIQPFIDELPNAEENANTVVVEEDGE